MPGDALPSERELMREFGVGRPAVREALFHLRSMGLIELRSGERARVAVRRRKRGRDALGRRAPHLSSPEASALPGSAHISRGRTGAPRRPACNRCRLDALKSALEANREAMGDLTNSKEPTSISTTYWRSSRTTRSSRRSMPPSSNGWSSSAASPSIGAAGRAPRSRLRGAQRSIEAVAARRCRRCRRGDARSSRTCGRRLLGSEAGQDA